MKTLRFYSIVLVLVLLAGFSSAKTVKRGPGGGDEIIAVFNASDANFSSGRCASYDTLGFTEEVCTFWSASYYSPAAYTLTRATVVIGTSDAWTTTEACDVDIEVASTSVASFEVGATTLDTAGDKDETSTFTNPVVAFGDLIQVIHTDPTDDTYCNSGSSCACTGANASYIVTIFGTR